jgi:RNA polymerase sigma-70 factor, ECF subfamily
MDCTLEGVYEAFHAPLRRFVLVRVGDAAAADDVLQEIYLRIHAHIDSLRDCSRLQAWVYQIARHTIVDYYRARRPAAELLESLTLPDDACVDNAECELAGSLAAMIDDLPEKYRQALSMIVYEGLTQQEAAERLGLSLSGAKSRVQRAREKLKDMLLNCCHFEFDGYGGILDYQGRCCCCVAGSASPALTSSTPTAVAICPRC